MAHKGECWNESETYRDPWTLRPVRRITSTGLYNQTHTYHTNTGFTDDGEYLIFGSARAGGSALFKAHVSTGEITQLIDPVEGTGSYNEWNRSAGATLGNGLGINGWHCIAPKTRWAVYLAGRSLRVVHLDTLEERTLIDDYGADRLHGRLSVDPTETYVIMPLMPAHPDLAAGRRPTRSYEEAFAGGGMQMELIQAPLAGGEVTTVYVEEGINCGHAPHSPTDPDLVLMNRDFVPGRPGQRNRGVNRMWTLRLSSGERTELATGEGPGWQGHSAWTWDGEGVLYHGSSYAQGGVLIGVVNRDGTTRREYRFPASAGGGHVSAMPDRPAIILDGNLSRDLLLWLYYDQSQPRVEVIARHGTDWGALPGQYSHPHPLADPSGRWISFNAAQKGRVDVFVVSV